MSVSSGFFSARKKTNQEMRKAIWVDDCFTKKCHLRKINSYLTALARSQIFVLHLPLAPRQWPLAPDTKICCLLVKYEFIFRKWYIERVFPFLFFSSKEGGFCRSPKKGTIPLVDSPPLPFFFQIQVDRHDSCSFSEASAEFFQL